MVILALIFIPTMVAVAGLVLLLNAINAGAGVSAGALGLIAVMSGAAIGYFSDRLPDFPGLRRGNPATTHRSRR